MEGDPEAMVLFIGPLVSLQQQLARSMGSHLTVMTWDSKGDKNAQQLAMKRGKYHVMGVAPEMFEMPWFLTTLRSEYWREHLAFEIVDEVHTVVDWANFRIYDGIREMTISTVRLCMMTVTAPMNMHKEIYEKLGLNERHVHVISRSIMKEDLHLAVRIPPEYGRHGQLKGLYLPPSSRHVRRHVATDNDYVMPRMAWFFKSATILNKAFKFIEGQLGCDLYSAPTSTHYHDALVFRAYSSHATRVKNWPFEFFVVDDKRWKGRLLLATSCGELGIDYKNMN
jgi:hypothetical protein